MNNYYQDNFNEHSVPFITFITAASHQYPNPIPNSQSSTSKSLNNWCRQNVDNYLILQTAAVIPLNMYYNLIFSLMLPLMSCSLTVIALYTKSNENAIITLKDLGYTTQVYKLEEIFFYRCYIIVQNKRSKSTENVVLLKYINSIHSLRVGYEQNIGYCSVRK